MNTRPLWRLACVAACAALAPTSACGNTTSNGNAPPVTGGGDGGSDAPSEASPQDAPSNGDGSPTEGGASEAAAGDGGTEADAGPSEGGPQDAGSPDAGDGASVDSGMETGPETDGPWLPDGSGPLCNPLDTWGAPVTVLTTAAADATIFGSVTPDELTLAWASSTGGVVTGWYADRASTGVAFGTPQQLNTSFGALSLDRLSLGGDGLRIVGISSNGSAFVAAKRAARTGPFDTDDSAEFTGIRIEGQTSTYATPLLSSDNEFLFYISPSSTDDHVLNVSPGGPPWTAGAPSSATQLERVGSQYRRPSGISADDLTLFYWDETTGAEGLAFRSSPAADFTVFFNIGALTNAAPTASCSRIYYSVPAAAGAITIVYADGSQPDN